MCGDHLHARRINCQRIKFMLKIIVTQKALNQTLIKGWHNIRKSYSTIKCCRIVWCTRWKFIHKKFVSEPFMNFIFIMPLMTHMHTQHFRWILINFVWNFSFTQWNIFHHQILEHHVKAETSLMFSFRPQLKSKATNENEG